MRTLRPSVLASFFGAALLLAACGDDGGSGAGTSGGGGQGASGEGASSEGASGGDGGSTSSGFEDCQPACEAPQFCSVENVCIDEGTCLGDGDCTQKGFECDEETETCVPGGECGGMETTIESVPPNLLIVLDRSCSMDEVVQGTGMTKWQIAVAALNTMTTNYTGQIRFGLSMFPDTVPQSCAQDSAYPFPPGPGNEAGIQALLTASLQGNDPNFPDGPCVTNIDTAMEQAAAEPELLDMSRDNFALLITDGKQSGCNLAGGDAGTEAILASMLTTGIPTFVLGFGSGVDPVQMDEFANAGGVPNSGPAYYDASDQASLDLALETIANATISCEFVLDEVPPDPDQIFVFFDDEQVSEDGTDGWTYDPDTNTISFHGPTCDTLQSGSVEDVDVVFDCPFPTPD